MMAAVCGKTGETGHVRHVGTPRRGAGSHLVTVSSLCFLLNHMLLLHSFSECSHCELVSVSHLFGSRTSFSSFASKWHVGSWLLSLFKALFTRDEYYLGTSCDAEITPPTSVFYSDLPTLSFGCDVKALLSDVRPTEGEKNVSYHMLWCMSSISSSFAPLMDLSFLFLRMVLHAV